MLNEARRFYLAAPVLLPILEKRRNDVVNRLLAKHRDGDTNYVTLVTELAVITGIEKEISSKEAIYRAMEAKK